MIAQLKSPSPLIKYLHTNGYQLWVSLLTPASNVALKGIVHCSVMRPKTLHTHLNINLLPFVASVSVLQGNYFNTTTRQ